MPVLAVPVLAAFLWAGFCVSANAQSSAAAAMREQTRSVLILFGVDPTSEAAVARFLIQGIPPTMKGQELPTLPRLRSQLLPIAMETAASNDFKLAAAPLLRLAQRDFSAGIELLLSQDAATLPAAQRLDFMERSAQSLEYNALNALSLMGEKAALPLIRRQVLRQNSTLGEVQYALAGATLGDKKFIEPILAATRAPEREAATGAFQALEWLSGRPFGVSPQTSMARRVQAAEEAEKWWRTEGRRMRLDSVRIRERRLAGVAPTRPAMDRAPTTLRDHLIHASDLAGAVDTGGKTLSSSDAEPNQARASRRVLGNLDKRQVGLLGKVALDPLEDIDVRVEALRWLVINDRAQAEPVLKKLRNDPDAEISVLARAYLE